MFCYQREFRLPTETVTQQLLHQLVGSPQTRWLTQEHRRWRDAMPSIVADAALQEQWAKDEEYQKWYSFKFLNNDILLLCIYFKEELL